MRGPRLKQLRIAGRSRRAYGHEVKRVFFGSVLVCLLALSVQSARPGAERWAREPSLVDRHLETAIRYMDLGNRSSEYRASVGFLRAHAGEALHYVRAELLDETGTIRKWQLVYLMGELVDERAIALLETLLELPLPEPQTSRSGSHAIDLRHAEEVRVRFRAVASIARIGSLEPDLRDRAVSALVDIGREMPLMTRAVIFELRLLLGEEAASLRDRFAPEYAREFDRFVPPPRWQRLMSERMQAAPSLEGRLSEKGAQSSWPD
jgi:hypothetical protein